MPTYLKKAYVVADLVSATENAAAPVLAVYTPNTIRGEERHYFVASNNPKIYLFGPDQRKLAPLTPTVVGTVLADNPALHDMSLDSGKTYSIPANTSEDANYVQWDLGTAATRYIVAKAYSETTNLYAIVKVSADGTTWTDVVRAVYGTAAKTPAKLNFRYVRMTASNSNTSAYNVTFYEIEVYDPAAYLEAKTGTGYVAIEHVSTNENQKCVIFDGGDLLNYYAARIKMWQISFARGVVEVT